MPLCLQIGSQPTQSTTTGDSTIYFAYYHKFSRNINYEFLCPDFEHRLFFTNQIVWCQLGCQCGIYRNNILAKRIYHKTSIDESNKCMRKPKSIYCPEQNI